MCDLERRHGDFGFLVDAPQIRALIFETRRLTEEIADVQQRVDALRPAFSTLLGADGWLPKAYGEPDLTSGMGGGIGQYALYRAEDGSLCLFSLVIPAGSQTPIHDHLAWGLIGVYRGVQDVKTVSDTASISIHLLANDTACVTRHRFDATTGIVTPFRSGYSNAACPERT
jgi:3-mercaptopropionate dioxygenase